MAVAQSVNGAVSVNGAMVAPVRSGLAATIDRYVELETERKRLDKAAREVEKQAKILETAISDAVEVAGGMLEAGPYVLAFEFVKGVPGYKGICETHIAPAVLLAEIEATPKRRKLVIA